jgi:hypothetical protein
LSAVLAKTIELDRRNIFSQGPKIEHFVQKMQQIGVGLAKAGTSAPPPIPIKSG